MKIKGTWSRAQIEYVIAVSFLVEGESTAKYAPLATVLLNMEIIIAGTTIFDKTSDPRINERINGTTSVTPTIVESPRTPLSPKLF